MSAHIWTPQEDAKIVSMLARGYSRMALARALKRKPNKIGVRLEYLVKTGAVHWAKKYRQAGNVLRERTTQGIIAANLKCGITHKE